MLSAANLGQACDVKFGGLRGLNWKHCHSHFKEGTIFRRESPLRALTRLHEDLAAANMLGSEL